MLRSACDSGVLRDASTHNAIKKALIKEEDREACSAQMASICLFMSEHKGYPCLPPLALDEGGQHPCDLPVHPFRFRDNLVGVKHRSTPIECIQRGFEHIYNIPLQVENVGQTLTSLESDLYIARDATGTNFVGARMACKTSLPDTPGKFKYRYPEPHVPHARRTVASLVPAEAKRAIYYRVTEHDLHSNVRGVVATFERKGYPTSWWKPLLRERLHRWGVRLEDCYEDQSLVVLNQPLRT